MAGSPAAAGKALPIGARAKRQLLSIQALRGLAALLVVVAHLIEHGMGDAAPNAAKLSGRFGVEIFFVISGFVIHHAASDGRFQPGVFAIRRIFRIVPLYWATTLLVALLSILIPQIYKTTIFTWPSLIQSLLFIPYEYPIGSGDWRPLFKLGWTLNYEIFFYAAVLALFWCRSARLRAIGLTIIMGAIIARAQFPRDPSSVSSFYISLNLAPFLLGVWIAEAWRTGWIERTGARAAMVAVPIAILLVALFYQVPAADLPTRNAHMLMTAAAVMLVVAALTLEREGGDVPFILWIGDISFSIYLLHMFITGALWAVANRLLHGDLGMASVTAIVTVGVTATIILSGISYRWFEMPINRVGSRLARSAAKGSKP